MATAKRYKEEDGVLKRVQLESGDALPFDESPITKVSPSKTKTNTQGLATDSPTMEESGFVSPYYSPEDARQGNMLYEQANAKVDERAIRRNYIDMFQDQINSLNQVYDQQLSKAKQEGLGRVGSGTAILARRGLGGSPRGEAIKEGVLDVNRGVEGAIQDERSLAIQAIFGKATELAQNEAAERRVAKESGATKYLEFLKGSEDRKVNNMNSTISALIAQGIDPSTLEVNELNDIAKSLGVDAKALLGSYKVAKINADQAAELARAEGAFNLSEGQARYDADGNLIASRGKPGTGGTGGGSANISSEAQNIIDLINVGGGSVNDYVKGTSNAAQALRNEVLSGLASQGGYTNQTRELFADGVRVAKEFLENQDYKKLGGYSAKLGGQFTPGYGDAKQRADQLVSIITKDTLGLMKGVLTDRDIDFLKSMATGFAGEGLVSEDFVKSRVEEIQTKLERRLQSGDFAQPAQSSIIVAPDGVEVEIID